MQDFDGSLDYQPHPESGNQEQALSASITDTAWPDDSSVIQLSSQDLTSSQFPLPWGEQAHLVQPRHHPQLRGRPLDNVSTVHLGGEGDYWPDFQHSPWLSGTQAFNTDDAVPPPSVTALRAMGLPLTPPCSTRSEEESPFCRSEDNHFHIPSCAPTVNVQSIGPFSGLQAAGGNAAAPPTPPEHTSDGTMWNGELEKLLELDPLLANLESRDHGLKINSLPDGDWQSENMAVHNLNGSFVAPAKEQWPVSAFSQPAYSNSYPFSPPDHINDPAVPDVANDATANHNCGETVQALIPDASATFSSLFQCLSPEPYPPQLEQRVASGEHQRSSEKDRQLIDWKNQGLSYKEIRSRGRFNEAESTLRGRYRTLTKPKHLRVRKPDWKSRDVAILLEAVDRHLQHHGEEESVRDKGSTEAQRRASKVPWKQVAEYMERRGCYRYGNATVKKKYLKVMDGTSKF